ncbi:MAG: hypothetical protein V8S95_10890 [Odoribacter sp.]
MPVNLGWCDGTAPFMTGIAVWFGLKTAVNSRIFDLHQSAHTTS